MYEVGKSVNLSIDHVPRIIPLLLLALLALGGCKPKPRRPYPMPPGAWQHNNPLIDEINRYRMSLGLPPVPPSRSLNHVAWTHVMERERTGPPQPFCNLHSWSPTGFWSPCCYTPDNLQAPCMWNKPTELTSYPGRGYEVAAWSSGPMTAFHALSMWRTSPGHHDTITNRGIWANQRWMAVGAAQGPHYAVAWFGTVPDPAR